MASDPLARLDVRGVGVLGADGAHALGAYRGWVVPGGAGVAISADSGETSRTGRTIGANDERPIGHVRHTIMSEIAVDRIGRVESRRLAIQTAVVRKAGEMGSAGVSALEEVGVSRGGE